MPFKSEAQRRKLWKDHPAIARRWAKEYPNQKKLPLHKSAIKRRLGKRQPPTKHLTR